MNLLALAIQIASTAFVNKTDAGGKPYILHCLWVMDKVRHLGEDYMIVAILHDLIEDTHWTAQMLLDKGFSETIVNALVLVDFRDCIYIDRIKEIVVLMEADSPAAELAGQVKLRDLEHNSKITRLKGLEVKDFERLKKYNTSYKMLEHLRK